MKLGHTEKGNKKKNDEKEVNMSEKYNSSNSVDQIHEVNRIITCLKLPPCYYFPLLQNVLVLIF